MKKILITVLIFMPSILKSQEINESNKKIIDENYITYPIDNFFVIKNKINALSKYGIIDKKYNTISPLIFDTIYKDQENKSIFFKKNEFESKIPSSYFLTHGKKMGYFFISGKAMTGPSEMVENMWDINEHLINEIEYDIKFQEFLSKNILNDKSYNIIQNKIKEEKLKEEKPNINLTLFKIFRNDYILNNIIEYNKLFKIKNIEFNLIYVEYNSWKYTKNEPFVYTSFSENGVLFGIRDFNRIITEGEYARIKIIENEEYFIASKPDSIDNYGLLSKDGIISFPFLISTLYYDKEKSKFSISFDSGNEFIYYKFNSISDFLLNHLYIIDNKDILAKINNPLNKISYSEKLNKLVKENESIFKPRGEFETTAEYNSRLKAQMTLKNELTYRISSEEKKKTEEYLAKEKYERNKKEEELKLIKANTIKKSIREEKFKIEEISSYNADETYFIIKLNSGDKYKIIIPLREAPLFKEKYSEIEISAISILNEDLKSNRLINFKAKNIQTSSIYLFHIQEDLSKYNVSFVNSSSIATTKITALPKLVSTIQFNDDNGNDFLDGDEKSSIKIVVRNDGDGLAQGVNIKTQVDNSIALEFKSDNYIGQIEPKSEKSVIIPVRALESITSGTRNFKLLINEANGFNPSPIELTVPTKELIKPSLKLSEVGIENTITKLPILKQSETSTVTFRVQNNSKADAKNLVFNIQIPNNVFLLGGNKRIEIAELKAGLILDIPIDIAPNNLANASEEFKLTYSGKYLNGTFSKNLSIESNTVASNKVVISGKEETSSNYNEVITADLNIDIENNIPVSKNINKNAIAVVLGIEKYKNVGNVSFASRDASIVKEYFNKALGIPVENIYFKLNGDVTKGEMEKIFGGWIKNRVDVNTSVYIYYAGHGAPSGDQNAYLIPNDGDPNYAEETGYSLNKMYDQLGKLPTDNITVFLDACFSGQDREQKLLIKDARGLGIKTKTSAIPDKLNVFSASSNDQVSSGWPDKKHGLFTYYMLRGIQGSADTNNDKQVSYEELSNYIKSNVERQAGFLDRKQNPQSKIVNLNTYFK